MSPVISGGSSGGGAITVADGADVVEGATTDVAVTGDNAGTINAHLRGLTKDLGDPAALADATANPTRSSLAVFGMVWNGATWDRVPGSTRGQWIEGNVAADGVLTANPLPGGGRASTAVPTAVSADGDAVPSWMTRNGATVIDGGVASAAADSGNPVKMGGRYNATKPTLTDGQRGDLQMGTRGAVGVTIFSENSTTTFDIAGVNADGTAAGNVIKTMGQLFTSNGTTWDRVRGNLEATLLASAARTATTSSADQTNYNGRGVLIVVNVTAEGGTTTLTLTVQGKDSISSNYYDLITGIVVYNASTDTPTTTRGVLVYPGVLTADAIGAGTANLISAKSLALPRTWRATITPSDATSQTYSVSGVTIL